MEETRSIPRILTGTSTLFYAWRIATQFLPSLVCGARGSSCGWHMEGAM